MNIHNNRFLSNIKIRDLLAWKSPLPWFVGIVIILLGYILIGNHNETFFLRIFALAGKSQFLDNLMRFSAAYLYIVVLGIAGIWAILTQKGKYIPVAFSYIFVGIIAYLLSKIGTHLIIDIRPYLAYHLTPLISVAKDNGFPSDHTMLMAVVASVTSLYSKTIGWVLFVLMVLVAFARVYVAAHHPLDVVGSMVIVILALLVFLSIIQMTLSLSNKSEG